MANKKDMKDLLDSLSQNMTPEETLLAGLQGVIAGTISMKRQLLGMSQKDLAEKLGVSQGLVSRWERADANFTLETLVRIASALDLNMQSPIVPALPQTFSLGSSNVFQHPAAGQQWESRSYIPNVEYDEYDAKEN